MASIPFVKATACGNDFLIIDFAHVPSDVCSFSRRICDRHNGVGADGVEWVLPATDADLRVRLLNADGSEAEISGNGTRCVAAWYCAENDRSSVVIRTGAGLKTCFLTAREGNSFEFRSSMGEPEVGDEFTIKFTYGGISGIPISMGNPHFVVYVAEFELGWQAVAGQISTHDDFKHGMNVELVKVFRYGFLRRRSRFHPYWQSEVAGARACSRRSADSRMEQRSVSPRPGYATLPG